MANILPKLEKTKLFIVKGSGNMPNSIKKTLQLYRNETVFEPGNGLTALEVAKQELSSRTLNDGEILIARYQETNDEIRTVVAVAHHINNNSGISFFTECDSKVKQTTKNAAANVTINPYVLNDFGTVSMDMTISFNTSLEVSGYTKEYIIRFVAGNGCAITLPNGVLYANGVTPTYTVGHTYEIDIVNGCAAVGEFY